MAGEFFREFRALSTDWFVGSFVGATLDLCFNFLHSKSHILNLISALTQLTCATFIVHEILYGMGARKRTNTIQETWLLYTAVWEMSPNAVKKLSRAYYSFHKLLYGTRSLIPDLPTVNLPEKPATSPSDPVVLENSKKACNC